MNIKVLAENTSVSNSYLCEHGLSLYIETKNHKLLFDTGASALFAENAGKLNVDLSNVDTTIISHGHHDHGGGLKTFLKHNTKAKVYFSGRAFEKHYANFLNGGKTYIGLDRTLLPDEQFVFINQKFVIDDELELFSEVSGIRFNPSGNTDLFKKIGASYELDDFAHEQNLIIREDGRNILVSGCSHSGIVNIIEHFCNEYGLLPDVVIGGFHLYNPARDENESFAIVDEIGEYMVSTNAKYFTCHCTGLESYERLKVVMGDKIAYLSTGSQIYI